jgi:hypothetical protein
MTEIAPNIRPSQSRVTPQCSKERLLFIRARLAPGPQENFEEVALRGSKPTFNPIGDDCTKLAFNAPMPQRFTFAKAFGANHRSGYVVLLGFDSKANEPVLAPLAGLLLAIGGAHSAASAIGSIATKAARIIF